MIVGRCYEHLFNEITNFSGCTLNTASPSMLKTIFSNRSPLNISFVRYCNGHIFFGNQILNGQVMSRVRNLRATLVTKFLNDCLQLFSAVQFDFLNNTIRLATSQPFTPNESWLISQVPIVKQPNVGLAIEGAIFGKTMPIVLDLAGDYTLANPTGDKTPARQLSFGDLVFRQVSQIPLPPNALPRVGRNLFVGLIVTICPQDGIVYFERPQ